MVLLSKEVFTGVTPQRTAAGTVQTIITYRIFGVAVYRKTLTMTDAETQWLNF